MLATVAQTTLCVCVKGVLELLELLKKKRSECRKVKMKPLSIVSKPNPFAEAPMSNNFSRECRIRPHKVLPPDLSRSQIWVKDQKSEGGFVG